MTTPNQQPQHHNQGQQSRPQNTPQSPPSNATEQIQEKDEVDYSKQKLTAKNFTFKEVFALLVSQVLDEKITSQQSKKFLHDWYRSMTENERIDFIANRVDADTVVNYMRGVVDTLAQELPYLLSNM